MNSDGGVREMHLGTEFGVMAGLISINIACASSLNISAVPR